MRRIDHDGYDSPDDYEAALAPIYRLIHWASSRRCPRARRTRADGSSGDGSGRVPTRAPAAAPGVPAMEQVVHNLDVDARHVLFGHLHAPGRWETGGGAELVNTGSWVEDPTSRFPPELVSSCHPRARRA